MLRVCRLLAPGREWVILKPPTSTVVCPVLGSFVLVLVSTAWQWLSMALFTPFRYTNEFVIL